MFSPHPHHPQSLRRLHSRFDSGAIASCRAGQQLRLNGAGLIHDCALPRPRHRSIGRKYGGAYGGQRAHSR
jgi:hypothetical protein